MHADRIVGTVVSHYRVRGFLGRGGMGLVFKAEDQSLGRAVALKMLPSAVADEPQAIDRLRREARAASRLNHPNICTIHEIAVDPASGHPFIAMELLEGQTLRAVLGAGPLRVSELLHVAIEIVDGLDAAHRAGVVHRDLKPANIFVTTTGRVKLLDFGLAKTTAHGAAATLSDAEPSAVDVETLTVSGVTVGTIRYMSPEQLRGEPVDARTDLFSFGLVLYEMATGHHAFDGSTSAIVIDAILNRTPDPPSHDNGAIPAGINAIVAKALAKDRTLRYQHAAELRADLERVRGGIEPGGARVNPGRVGRRSATIGAAALLLSCLVAAATWRSIERHRWALERAPTQVEQLIEAADFQQAAAVVQQARAILPNDPTLEALWRRTTGVVSVTSTPSGAEVSFARYGAGTSVWNVLGTTPLTEAHVPRMPILLQITKSGYVSQFVIDSFPEAGQPGEHSDTALAITLRPENTVPKGMLPVPGSAVALNYPHGLNAPVVRIEPFLIDQHEVTNEEFQRFVDAGGYRRPEFWIEPFVRDGRVLSWENAMSRFRDATGRPGPASWEAGSYPAGLAHHPVAGVSWYEAAAYARFAGKSLPTAYHWTKAAQAFTLSGLIASGGNFSGAGTREVDAPGAASGYGTSDMAGNVKEWCWNEGHAGKRFILGGGFGEPTYMFYYTDEQSPWDRRSNFGFRCAKYDTDPSGSAMAPIVSAAPDFMRDKPVSDSVFAAFAELYRYDRTDLNARIEQTEETTLWTHLVVSFDAAYGHERVSAHLYLPKSVAPPFQTVVYFPGGYAMSDASIDVRLITEGLDYLMKSGRALMVPVYKGFYERRDGLVPGGKPPAFFRDHMIMFSKDLGRSLDYLESRPDIDRTKFAYLGFSMGGSVAPVLLGIEKRFKAAVVSSGGLQLRHDLPEDDAINFLPRIRIPVLMLNGRYDSSFPIEASQNPLFQLLGTPNRDKKHVIYDAGHGYLPHRDEIRETLDWLDKYLGAVGR